MNTDVEIPDISCPSCIGEKLTTDGLRQVFKCYKCSTEYYINKYGFQHCFNTDQFGTTQINELFDNECKKFLKKCDFIELVSHNKGERCEGGNKILRYLCKLLQYEKVNALTLSESLEFSKMDNIETAQEYLKYKKDQKIKERLKQCGY